MVDGQLVEAAGTYDFVTTASIGRASTGRRSGAAAREKSGPAPHALIAQLGVGSMTASALTMGTGIAALFALVGLTVVLFGLGLVWAARASTEKVKAPAFKQVTTPPDQLRGSTEPHRTRPARPPKASCYCESGYRSRV